jgi:hypothetical protein
MLSRYPSIMGSSLIYVTYCTGGPRYSRSFYPRFRLFAVRENIQKFKIRGLSLAFSRFLTVFYIKSSFKQTFCGRTVLPHLRGFRIRGVLSERIYRELRGPPVLEFCSRI